jgi:hypothetical protein
MVSSKGIFSLLPHTPLLMLSIENPGNQLFRQVIEGALPRYTTAATKHAKSSIVSSLVDVIRKSSPNGFLRYDDEIRTWIKLDDYAARKWSL